MHPMLNIALRAVRKAGHLIAKHYETLDIVRISQQANSSFVNHINKVVKITEAIIIDIIRKSYPQHAILIEKKSIERIREQNQDIQWIIDPLDGITNFIKRLPHFSISIAVRIKGRTEIAVIYDPMRNELFTAVRGQGAQLNSYRLRGSNARTLNRAILATCFFKLKNYRSLYVNIEKLLTECADLRCTGSTALDLAYVAAGRIDGYFEISLKPWNFTAGDLIVREAGVLVCDFTGDHKHLLTGNIIAGNSHMVKAMLGKLKN